MARSSPPYNHILVKHLRIGLEEFIVVTRDGINDAHSALHGADIGLAMGIAEIEVIHKRCSFNLA